jgi:hypothetical protein
MNTDKALLKSGLFSSRTFSETYYIIQCTNAMSQLKIHKVSSQKSLENLNGHMAFHHVDEL